MPCGHSFCLKCVTQLKECSICRTPIRGSKPNYSLIEILEDEKLQIKNLNENERKATEDSVKKSNQEATILIKEAFSLHKEKKYSQSLSKFDEALEKCTNDFNDKYSMLWWKAEIFKELGNYSEAYTFYYLAIEITPQEKQSIIKNQLANCLKKEAVELHKEKKYSESLKKFTESLEKCTNDYYDKYALLWWKAGTLKELGNFSEASTFFFLALELAPQEKKETIEAQMKINISI